MVDKTEVILVQNFWQHSRLYWWDGNAWIYSNHSGGKPCVFPFKLDNTWCYGCLKSRGNDHWCATTSSYDRDSLMGICPKHAPIVKSCEVKPIKMLSRMEQLAIWKERGGWGEWGFWTCCMSGAQFRTRKCHTSKCNGKNYDFRMCNKQPCKWPLIIYIVAISPAVGGQKVEVEYVQTFIAVS